MLAMLVLAMGACKKSSYDIDYATEAGPYAYALHGAKGDGNVLLQWQPLMFICNINCPPIVRFDVRKYLLYMATPDDNAFRLYAEYPSNQQEARLAGLRNDEPYQFRLVAVGVRDSFSVSNHIMVVPGKEISFEKTDTDGSMLQPAWSHDGEWLSFVSYQQADGRQAEAVSLQQQGQPAAVLQLRASQPAWSPRANSLIYRSELGLPLADSWYQPAQLMLYDVENNTTAPLTDGLSQDQHPVWSPDGKFVAFLSDRGGIQGQPNLWALELETGNMEQLTAYGGANQWVYWNYPPTWSPDGKQLAFSVSNGGGGEVVPMRIFARNESGDIRALWPTSQWDDYNPAWSPDGTQLAFISRRTGGDEIWLYSFANSQFKQLTAAADGNHPDVHTKGYLSWSSDGSKLYFSGRSYQEGYQMAHYEINLP